MFVEAKERGGEMSREDGEGVEMGDVVAERSSGGALEEGDNEGVGKWLWVSW